MLSEALTAPGAVCAWGEAMPGARFCLFTLPDGAQIAPELAPMHFEAFFCLGGALTIERRGAAALTVPPREVLILTDAGGVDSAVCDGALSGVLISVDARGAGDSLRRLCALLGGPELDTRRVARLMDAAGGCMHIGAGAWTRSAFERLERLPAAEQGRYGTLKSVELLYLLSAGGMDSSPAGGPNPAMARSAAAAKAYMSAHLDERLTIPELSRRFCVSATALKAAFRELYGQPIHTWLREKRMERAAELLRLSDMSVLDISQAVGFASPSQFGANFLKRFGASPGKYRKMSVSVETAPETGGQGGGESV